MSQIKKAIRDVQIDIQEIVEVIDKGNHEVILDLHIKIDGKYQSKINDWGKSMYGYRTSTGFVYSMLSTDSLIDNLKCMKAKLEGYIQTLELTQFGVNEKSNGIVIYNENNNTNINYVINFEEIESVINNNESLTSEETSEAIKKLKELQKIYESKDSRKNKWEKTKSILVWLADKSVDFAIAYFPVIFSMLKK